MNVMLPLLFIARCHCLLQVDSLYYCTLYIHSQLGDRKECSIVNEDSLLCEVKAR